MSDSVWLKCLGRLAWEHLFVAIKCIPAEHAIRSGDYLQSMRYMAEERVNKNPEYQSFCGSQCRGEAVYFPVAGLCGAPRGK